MEKPWWFPLGFVCSVFNFGECVMKNISLLIKIKTFQGPFAPKQFSKRARGGGWGDLKRWRKRVFDSIEISSSSCEAKKFFSAAAVLPGN